MSSLQVANLHLESTANNRIQYDGANTFSMYAGGVDALSVNSTAVAAGITISAPNGAISTNTFTLGSSSLAANGYSRLPNGLLMQWGFQAASVNNSTVATATFPVAFTTVYNVSITSQGNLFSVPPLVNAVSTSTFTWKTTYTGVASAANVYYLAIGT